MLRAASIEPHTADAHRQICPLGIFGSTAALQCGYRDGPQQNMEGGVQQRGMQRILSKIGFQIGMEFNMAQSLSIPAHQLLNALKGGTVFQSSLVELPV